MKKHIIDQNKGEYPLPTTHVTSWCAPHNPDLVSIYFYATGWYRQRNFHTHDIERVEAIFTQLARTLQVENIQEYFKQKYMQWVQQWSIPYSDVLFDSAYALNQSLWYDAFPWVINFELTKLLASVEGDVTHKNLAMSMIRSEVAYAIKAVPGD